MKLIENCRHWWKLWSIRLNALGLALMAWIQIDPVSVLAVWNMLPGHTASYLPRGVVAALGGILFLLSMMSRLVHQPKLERPNGQ